MKNFLFKITVFLIPFLLVLIAMEFLVREIPNDYSYKNDYLDLNSKNIEVLFLGSSHSYYGINPDLIPDNAFNASHISQSINYDYEIIKKYKNNWNQLKYIVIPIDYFTLFSRVATGRESWRIKNYQIYYNIQKNSSLKGNSEILSLKLKYSLSRIYRYYLKNESAITCSKLGYGNIQTESKDLKLTGEIAAKKHTKLKKQYFKENVSIINSIIDLAKKNGSKIIFYTSPAYHTYISNLDKTQLDTTYNTIQNIVKNNPNTSYFNFLEDKTFSAQDYRDADHLNDSGAIKLTNKLNSIIQEGSLSYE